MNIKQQVHTIADELPEDATWEDVMYALSIVRDIEAGLADSEADRVVDTSTLRTQLGLPG